MRFANGLAGPWMPGQEIGPRGSAPCQQRSAVFFLDFGRYRHRAQCCTASSRCVSTRESYPTSTPRIHLHADSFADSRARVPSGRSRVSLSARTRPAAKNFLPLSWENTGTPIARARDRVTARDRERDARRSSDASPTPPQRSSQPSQTTGTPREPRIAERFARKGRFGRVHTQPSSARCVGPTLEFSRKGTARVASSPTESSGRDDGQTRRRGRG